MKERWESSETFEAYATIDYCYYRLGKIQEEINKVSPKTSIDMLIDNATGFTDAVWAKHIPELIDLFECIVEADKVIERDSANAIKVLEALKNTFAICD